MNESLNTPAARRSARRPKWVRLAAATALGTGVGIATLAADPAMAADECGPSVAGRVVCTSAGNPYPDGITYAPAAGLSLTTNADTSVTGPLTISGVGTIAVEHDGAIATVADGARGIDLTGDDVAVTVVGSVATTGARTPDIFDDAGNLVTPGVTPTAVLVNATTGAASVTNNGAISTTGDNASGIDATGVTGVTVVNTGSVTTSGSSAAGVNINSGADVTLRLGGTVSTVNAVGVAVTSTGGVQGSIANVSSQQGAAVSINAGGAVTLDIGSAIAGADAVNVTSSSGPISVTVRDVVAPSYFYGAVSVAGAEEVTFTATGNLTGGVRISAGTTGSVLIASGARVDGDVEVNNGSNSGSVSFRNQGFLAGRLSFGGTGNRVVNDGTLALTQFSVLGATGSSDNTLVNTGTVKILKDPNRVGPNAASYALRNLTAFQNSGTIDLRNGVAGDVLSVTGILPTSNNAATPGTFTGSGGSTLYLDVKRDGSTSIADQLTATGAITGSTNVVLNVVSGAATLTPGLVFAQGGAGTSATAFNVVLPGDTALVHYSTAFDPATNSFALVGSPGDALVRVARNNEAAGQLWYRSADTVSSHFSELRDARYGGYAKGGGRVWGTMYGQVSRRRGSLDTEAFGVSREVSAGYRQNTFGGQLGFDVVGGAADDFAVGITGGFQKSNLNYARSADTTRFNAANVGLLVGFQTSGFFANALGKFDYLWVRSRTPEAASSDTFNGTSYGGQVELGYRFGSTSLYVEPVATIAYVRTDLDDTRLSDIALDYGTFQGLRGKAGARIGSKLDLGGGATAIVYAQGNYVHEFKGDGATRFEQGGVGASVSNRALPDYGEGRLGFSAGSAGGVTGFVEGFGTAGRSYRGGGGRAGIRVPM